MHTRHRAPKQTLYSIIFRRVKYLEAIIDFFGWDSSQMVNTHFSTLIDRKHVTQGKGTTKEKATDTWNVRLFLPHGILVFHIELIFDFGGLQRTQSQSF